MFEELIAIDIGNSRIKVGRFTTPGECVESAQQGIFPIAQQGLPDPIDTLAGTIEEFESGILADWLGAATAQTTRVVIASVSKPICTRIQALIPFASEVILTEQFPIELRVDFPDRLGADRAAAAVAANVLRRPGMSAIVVDLGTAITVDLISVEGAFEGGAILPGPRLSAAALSEQTDALPCYNIADLDASPDPVGRSTEPAILAGLYWGAVGAIREIIARQCDRLTKTPQVFFTGGASPAVAKLVAGPDYAVRHVDHLTLSGIAVAARQLADETSDSGEQ